jgi:hypothetical protein
MILLIITWSIFQSVKSKHLFRKLKRSIISTLLSFAIIGVTYIEVSKLKILKIHKLTSLNYIDQILNYNKKNVLKSSIDYKEEFKKYLSLDEIYESEKNYLQLLKRKTAFKAKEHSVVLIYVDSLTENNLLSNIHQQVFTFNNAFVNFTDPLKSIEYIKMNLPPTVSIGSKVDSKLIKSHYLNVFHDYTINDKQELYDLPEGLHFSIFHLSKLSKEDYIILNRMIRDHSADTVFAITTTATSVESFEINEDNYLDRSTFISFHIPRSLGSVDYKKNKIIGQEDIMTTLYNLALSEREYLSLGDDVFIDSNSNAINEDACIDSSGIYMKGKVFSEVAVNKLSGRNLSQKCESTKNIADFIIKQSLDKD